MISRVSILRAALALLAGLSIALVACRAPAPHRPRRREACLSEGLRDLAAWRWVEPRLSGGFTWQPCRLSLSPGHAVEEASCPPGHPAQPPVSMTSEGCDASVVQHVKALRTLAQRPGATEEAMETLETLSAQAPGDAGLLSDLAAAYLVRARRDDRPADLLHSLDLARRAVASAPGLPAARFNLAAAQQALQLPAAWEEYLGLDASSPWAAEARERRHRLAREAAVAEATSWSLNQGRLSLAFGAGDRQALAALIRPYPDAAQRFVEEEELPAWAHALSAGRAAEADRHLAMARALAAELKTATGDPYLADAVAVIANAAARGQGPVAIHALAAGHLALARARLAQVPYHGRAAEQGYRRASRWFVRARSPMRVGADLGLAVVQYQRGGEGALGRVLGLLEPIARESRAHGYRYLLGRALWIRALCLGFEGHPVESLAAYGDSLEEFTAMGDPEDAANVRVRRTGLYRTVGQAELAWREIFTALPQLPRMASLSSRHHLIGEAAATALALGFPDVALLYQDRAVAMIEEALRIASQANRIDEIENLRLQLAVALRWRTAIEVQAGRHAAAADDLEAASRLAKETTDTRIRRHLRTTILPLQGEVLRERNEPQRAIASWQAALEQLLPGEDRFIRASIYYQLALAYLGQKDRGGAERQLELGIEELRAQEKTILAGRRAGEGEELWAACFARFQAEYRLLIRMLSEDGREADAFEYAEKARAFEPLDLVLRSPEAPASFRRLITRREPMTLAEIQRRLPSGTFLVEYCALEDRLLSWVAWRGGFAPLAQTVSRQALAEWARALAESARNRNEEGFRQELDGRLAAIVTAPLAAVRQAFGGRTGLVVFVADGPLASVPLAALRDAGTGLPVVDQNAVAVAPSATLFLYSRLRDAAIAVLPHPAALLVGDPAFRPSALTAGLERLPTAIDEVKRIATLYPGTTPLTPEAATAETFLSRAGASVVVHFAGHAFSDGRYPFRSFLLLARSRDRDGELYAEEILRRLRLERTRLVVLASCSSVGGGPIGPEGLAPLVRPLLAVGAPAVLGSLWQVGNPGTEDLMVRFHRYYVHGEDAACALRHAQLDLEAGPALDWAPFQLVGQARPPLPPIHGHRRDPS